jgi:hypothetical protein
MVPVAVSGITTALRITAGNFHTCALLTSPARVACWGRGDEGQLGNGSFADSASPVFFSSSALYVSAGEFHNCLLTTGGIAQCWGRGDLGQLGNGAFENRAVVQTVSGITTATFLDAGRNHTCARLSSGALQCWGYAEFGQLGNGTGGPNLATPATVNGLNVEAVALAWQSSDTTVAAIAMSGHAQGIATGTAIITATYGDRTANAVLTIGADADGDEVPDIVDNCIEQPNADQRDSNGDNYGNVCDADLNNSGGVVNFADLALFRAAFGTGNADADLNGDGGVVNFADLATFRARFGRSPGPSGFNP